MKCKRCDMDSPEGANYCMHCGARINWANADFFFANAEELVRKLSDVLEEGNTRRIIIKDPEGNKVMDLSLTAGITAAAIAPLLAGAGILTALTKKYEVTLIRKS